jgi:hypothetical protein
LRSDSYQIKAIEILFKEDQDKFCVSFKNRRNCANAVELSQFCTHDCCVGAASISHSPVIYCASTARLADPRLVCGLWLLPGPRNKQHWAQIQVNGPSVVLWKYPRQRSTLHLLVQYQSSFCQALHRSHLPNESAAVLFLPMATANSVTPTNMVTSQLLVLSPVFEVTRSLRGCRRFGGTYFPHLQNNSEGNMFLTGNSVA